ncbi:MAG: AAA family ATPase [Huintestinicola sp.]|uniref:AAA family ATPase n=1 Tax=Huintestinicola sp. TaxID=2981661 RepID=UPI003F0C6B92
MSELIKVKEELKRYSIARIPFIAFETIERTRALDTLKEVADELNLCFYVHSMSKGIYDIKTGNVITDERSVYGAVDFFSEQIKHKQYMTLILTEVPDISSDNSDAKQLYDLAMLANESGGVVIVLTNNPVWNQLQRLGMTVRLDYPNEDEMYSIISDYINDYRSSISVEWDNNDLREAASSLTGITQIEAENVIASLIAKKNITKADLEEIKQTKDRLFSNISGLEKISVDNSAVTVGGLEGLQKWLDEKKTLLTPEKRDEMKKRGLHPPRGILLVGVPGCGKSLSAKAISASWKLPLYRLDFATVQGSYVGQSEQQLKDALTMAENVSPCILWIDEIEKGLAGSSGDSGVSTRMVGQFLFWLQECKKQVFVVATANDVSMLPSELLRRGRFDELFFVDLPTADERRTIISMYMKKYLKLQFAGDFSDKIVEATNGFTGADLESAVRDIAYRKLANDSFEYTEQTIMEAFENVVPLSKVSPERIESIRNWGRERAVPASGRPIGAQAVSSSNSPKTRKVLI